MVYSNTSHSFPNSTVPVAFYSMLIYFVAAAICHAHQSGGATPAMREVQQVPFQVLIEQEHKTHINLYLHDLIETPH